METVALFRRASQFGRHAAAVLQTPIEKPNLSHYEGKYGKISIEMEATFYRVIFESLLRFEPSEKFEVVFI